MYREKSIAVVVPAYNEQKQIRNVLADMPEFIDKIIVIDDCSKDDMSKVVTERQQIDPRVVLIRHEVNQGVGGAIATGYKWARDHGIDIAAVMAGDGQMDPADLPRLLDPIIRGEVDYTKGNKLLFPEAYKQVPIVRFVGNIALTFLTKIASGYWHVTDSQHGYTCCNRKVLKRIDWDKMYKRYGMPNDLLVRLNVENIRVRDVPIAPRYNVGEQSKLRVTRVTGKIAWLLLRMFLWRLRVKYVFRDFHPLVLFYFLGFVCFLLALALSIRVGYSVVTYDRIPPMSFLAFLFTIIISFQSSSLAMWFDMDVNQPLRGKSSPDDY